MPIPNLFCVLIEQTLLVVALDLFANPAWSSDRPAVIGIRGKTCLVSLAHTIALGRC